ncbi:hypothetical protein Q1695_012478 [Nippostrongylus brasiliensis]|nr:hypothetical protein Q1695_012478 [Nippostrongylus brasiliensis]
MLGEEEHMPHMGELIYADCKGRKDIVNWGTVADWWARLPRRGGGTTKESEEGRTISQTAAQAASSSGSLLPFDLSVRSGSLM